MSIDHNITMEWDGQRYHSINFDLKKTYGSRIWKLPVNAGMTCPNRDGRVGYGGCTFCSEGGSGDFALSARMTPVEQLDAQKALLPKIDPDGKFIAYFQAFTNTYAPAEYLRQLFMPVIERPDICILSVATRPDALPDDVIELLASLNRIKPVWVELGLQTIHEDTARWFRRGYDLSCFEDAAARLRRAGLTVIVHTILGFPQEESGQVLDTVRYLNGQDIQGIKLQLLHILKGTELAAEYKAKPFRILTKEAYIDLVIRCLEILSPEIAVHRVTGDAPRKLLIEPQWSTDKHSVLNELHHQMHVQNTWQGKFFQDSGTPLPAHRHSLP